TAHRAGAIKRLSRARAADLETIVLKALRKRPVERYATVQALADDLDRWQRGEPVQARPASAAYRSARFVARHRTAVAAGGLIAMSLLVAAGVSLWQAGRARSEAARALAVQGFLLDLFRTNSAEQADPERARRTTARQLLDIGAARLVGDAGPNDAFRDQPAAKQLLLETLGDLYRQLGLLPEASRLTEQGLELARRLLGPAEPALARALLDHAAVLDARERDSATEVMPLLMEAARVLDAAGDEASPLRARWHMQMSDHRLAQAPAEALRHAERSVALLRLQDEGQRGLDDALESLANASFRLGDQARGAALMEEAVQVARANGRHEATIAVLLKRAGEFNFIQGNRARADPMLREAMRLAERAHGEHGTGTIAVRLALARHLAGISVTSEARQLAERALADAAKPAGRGEPFQMPTVRRLVFEVMLAQGDIAAGRALLDAAFAEPAGLGGDTFEHADLLVDRAIVETAGRQFERARSTMQAAATMIHRLGLPPRSALSRSLAVVEADWHLARGDPAAALARLDAIQSAAGPGAAEQRPSALRARALAAAGSSGRAMQVVDEALAAVESAPNRHHSAWLEAELLQVRGEIRRAAGDCAAALEPLARAAALYAQVHVSTSPRRLETERALADCRRRLAAPSPPKK
ncbi:MAG: hypothetical protein JNN03_15675, partial [Rubrivivax sp.]|nr:hypothetical protein [Rubrivivax sp.]